MILAVYEYELKAVCRVMASTILFSARDSWKTDRRAWSERKVLIRRARFQLDDENLLPLAPSKPNGAQAVISLQSIITYAHRRK